MTLRTELTISDLLTDVGKVAIKCPKCNRRSQYTVGRVRANPNLKCPTCRTLFVVHSGQSNDDSLSLSR
jgi:transposase-like protein